ncbi:hypothetical protein RV11_GL000411 [Enterococcus phoeniculicola]|nr:hypothetical protein RV11_GL000411 [Enterococcus phoeniculicola]
MLSFQNYVFSSSIGLGVKLDENKLLLYFYDENKNIVLKSEKINERILFSSNGNVTYIMLNGEKVNLYPC